MRVNNYNENNPSADILMNSMRAMGYFFEAAIADVIDNSVAVKFSFNCNGASKPRDNNFKPSSEK